VKPGFVQLYGWPNWHYQITHLWHWVTYGNNATGIATLAAITAGIYAVRTYGATQTQLKLARKESRRSAYQAKLFKKQIELATAAFEQNKNVMAAQMAPQFVVDGPATALGATMADRLRITNTGSGRATNLFLRYQDSGNASEFAPPQEGLAPGRDFEFEVNLTRAMTTGMMLDYNNALGQRFSFRFHWNAGVAIRILDLMIEDS
jgi:hypothetical protein